MTPVVRTPSEAAEMLGRISVPALVRLLRAGGHAYTCLSPGAKPWGRGRRLWGMTDEQIRAVAAASAARVQPPAEKLNRPRHAAAPATLIPGHDGRSRLRPRHP